MPIILRFSKFERTFFFHTHGILELNETEHIHLKKNFVHKIRISVVITMNNVYALFYIHTVWAETKKNLLLISKERKRDGRKENKNSCRTHTRSHSTYILLLYIYFDWVLSQFELQSHISASLSQFNPKPTMSCVLHTQKHTAAKFESVNEKDGKNWIHEKLKSETIEF